MEWIRAVVGLVSVSGSYAEMSLDAFAPTDETRFASRQRMGPGNEWVGWGRIGRVEQQNVPLAQKRLGGGFKYFWNFNPKIGEDFQFDEHIFQMGGSTTNKTNWPKQKQLMVFGSLMILGEMI